MGGVSSDIGGTCEVTCFADQLPNTTLSRVDAIVLWRGANVGAVGPRTYRVGSLGHLGWRLRVLTYQPPLIWLRILAMFGRALMMRFMRPADHGEWSSRSSGDGRDIRLSRKRRIVRVLDREFALPSDGKSLILLVDGDRQASGSPQIQELAIDIPAFDYPHPDRTLPKEQLLAALRDRHHRERAARHAALRANPVIAAFMNPDA